jgi:hypothetical protein
MSIVLGWVESAPSDASHAARLAEVITKLHHNDQRMAGHSVQKLARASRARFYALHGNDVHMAGVFKTKLQTPGIPAVPESIADSANNIVGVHVVPAVDVVWANVLTMPTPAERAALDPAAVGADLLTVLAENEMPTVDLVYYWKSPRAIHAKAIPAQTTAFLTISMHSHNIVCMVSDDFRHKRDGRVLLACFQVAGHVHFIARHGIEPSPGGRGELLQGVSCHPPVIVVVNPADGLGKPGRKCRVVRCTLNPPKHDAQTSMPGE